MKLAHHDSRDYETASKEMAVNVMTRFERTIEQGQKQCQAVLEQIDNEIPTDRIIPSGAIDFEPVSDGVELVVAGETQEAIHDHAFGQFCERGGMHRAFANKLRDFARGGNGEGDWARYLLAENLRKLYHDGPGKDKRFLARSVDSEVRGWLSDAYRRLDCRPLLQSFHQHAIAEAGAVPVRGYNLPTRVAVRVVLPIVFEPVPNMPAMYGLEWHNSDFGHGAYSVRAFVHMPWCTNECTRDDVIKQVHHGKRLSDDFNYSQKTYQLDQDTAVSALGDTIKGLLAPAKVNETMEVIRTANEKDIDTKAATAMLKRTQLTSGEVDKVVTLFDSTDDHNMPTGKTKWRLSNAISFLATNTDNKYRALTLERLAGRVGGLATARGGANV